MILQRSQLKIAIIGGHPNIYREVSQALRENYGLNHWVELPSFSKLGVGSSKIKAKLLYCHLIFILTGYMRHGQTEGVSALKRSGAISGKVILLCCRGRTGVMRAILHHVDLLCEVA